MSVGIKVDNKGRIRSTITGRFLATPKGVHRIRVSDGVVFLFDEPKEKPLPPPTKKAKKEWGQWA